MDRDRPSPRPGPDRELRELLIYLRDGFRDAATRIDDYLGRSDAPPARGRDRNDRPDRGDRNDRPAWNQREAPAPQSNWNNRDHNREPPREPSREPSRDRDQAAWGDTPVGAYNARDAEAAAEIHEPLERLRDEVRSISTDAPDMEHTLLRLHVEAVTAETRKLQARATDPVDQETAARIMRALTAIVSEHRPGHVYGLARHHQTDWDEMARRARDEIRAHPRGDSRVASASDPEA